MKEFVRRYGPATIISQDWYYRSLEDDEKTAEINFDDPGRIDHDLFFDHLTKLRGGMSVAVPQYSFVTHQRLEAKLHVDPEALVLVEGLYPYWEPRARSLFDGKFYIAASAERRVARRMARDVDHRSRRVDEIEQQIIRTVLPMHEKYVEPQRALADIVICNDTELESAVVELQRGISGLLAGPGLFALGHGL